jgi:hypothetical protein
MLKILFVRDGMLVEIKKEKAEKTIGVGRPWQRTHWVNPTGLTPLD